MQDAVVDVCCLINFVAADCLPDVIQNSALRWHVPPMVLEEVVYVASEDGEPLSAAELLQTQFVSGTLTKCQLDISEQSLFITFAAELADGEAAALSIAANRGWWLATDDRKAIRLAAEHNVRVITTPELAKRWADDSGASDEKVQAALIRITKLARFMPRRESPEFSWWMDHLTQ
jgi:predicted nucleic acid-binding protein